VIDQQAPRVAFTLNEALCPRNKFVVGFQGAARRYRFVKAGSVRNNGGTILGTEWNQSWKIVADAGRGGGGDTVCKSHRPAHGFVGLGGQLNMDSVPADAFGGRPTYRRCTLNDLAADPQVGSASSSRLDWVGRNHDRKKLSTMNGRTGVDNRRTNFLYLDGHVETKHLFETVEPFQWGEEFYSLQPSNDVAG
jgi:prepilin-type processing-associated H-X9-DG protein